MFRIWFWWVAVVAAHTLVAAPPHTRPIEGLREHPPAVFAFTNAKIFVDSEKTLEEATLVIRDGSIIDVGVGIPLPADATVLEMRGKCIYPGLMDAFSETSISLPSGGAKHWSPLITPELNVSDVYQPDEAIHAKLRKQGVVCRLVAPSAGIIKGKSCIVSTADQGSLRTLWQPQVAQHVRLGIPRNRSPRSFPGSPMGAVALARQTFLDAEWYPRAWTAFQANRSLPRPEQNLALETLAASVSQRELFIFDTVNEIYLLRADDFAREFSLNAIMRGSGQEYQRLDAVRATGRPLLIPVNFPKPPPVDSPEAIREVSLSELWHWELAPENPARLHQAGVRFALTATDMTDVGEFLANVRVAVKRGLPAAAALASLTSIPAELFGIADRFGQLTQGRSASFIITDGPLFERKTKILETWVDGQRYPHEKSPPLDIRGTWEVKIADQGADKEPFVIEIRGTPEKLKANLILSAKEDQKELLTFTKIRAVDRRVDGSFPGKKIGRQGVVQFAGTLVETEAEGLTLTGQIAWPEGATEIFSAVRSKKHDPDDSTKQTDSQDTKTKDRESADDSQPEVEQQASAEDKSADKSTDEGKSEESEEPAASKTELRFPLTAFGRTASPELPTDLVVQHATIWTCGEEGILMDATMLVHRGKIVAVGRDVQIPAGATVIDGTGKHVSPGIIDCHSHMGTDGGINEGTQAITAEVRIGDFINCDDIDIYRQLAGGVTTANILHGSANPIGGQNQVIKLRWGELYDQMRFTKAPAGIKFALGENVKRSNMIEEGTRYPQSRMGVEQIIRDAFQAAKEYQQQWALWEQSHATLPPRKDLELEALAEVLRGQRWVHCHSYRQDEILALLRTCEEYGIRIATLQHILEGYKVADAMARHGAMGSSFSDWWAYKVEVYDAIPFNGALMHNAGVVVSFNSDDRELARHLNHEASKAVKYGGVPPTEALKFVTLNPAKQLRIDNYVGSIEPGKDADFVVWSGSPLSLLSRCEQTWIDGRKYFDIQEDLAMRQEQETLRAKLVQKVLASGEKMAAAAEQKPPEESLWPQEDEYCLARSLR